MKLPKSESVLLLEKYWGYEDLKVSDVLVLILEENIHSDSSGACNPVQCPWSKNVVVLFQSSLIQQPSKVMTALNEETCPHICSCSVPVVLWLNFGWLATSLPLQYGHSIPWSLWSSFAAFVACVRQVKSMRKMAGAGKWWSCDVALNDHVGFT